MPADAKTQSPTGFPITYLGRKEPSNVGELLPTQPTNQCDDLLIASICFLKLICDNY